MKFTVGPSLTKSTDSKVTRQTRKGENMKHTPEPWELEVGFDRCFHKGNRVAITTSGMDEDEPWNVTIAELWPADNDMDIKDGKLMVVAPKLLQMLQEITAAAYLVEENWEGSGLAEAIRFLLARRDEAHELLEKLNEHRY
jgi:hypothetical protein